MSFLQPTSSKSTEANTLSAPMIELKGWMANTDFVPAISGGVMVLALSRIGSDAIVQDLHAGAIGVLMLIASLLVYFILNTVLKRDEVEPYRTTGVFKFSRNPAYLAFFLPLASLAYFDAMTAAAATVIYVVAMNLLVIQQQEQNMQNNYGAGYSTYRAATPRWFA